MEPLPMNVSLDPFIVYINSGLEEKEEDVDKFITIEEINAYYELEKDEYSDFRIIIDECSKIPKKFSLNIIELNYLFCTILWDKGFKHMT